MSDQRNLVYAHFLAHSAHLPNSEWLAHMLSSSYVGMSYLSIPACLSSSSYQKLLDRHFPAITLPELSPVTLPDMPEKEDLFNLLMSDRNSPDEEIEWIAMIIIAGYSGNNHLWQDLGLWARKELTQLLEYNFPQLAAKNDQNMKWKKFLYKQLCLQENIYICRSPSCAVCVDYMHCFGTEE